MIAVLRRALTILRREIDADVLLLVLALTLIAVGFWNWVRPLSFIVPGAVLLWISIPARRPFVIRDPDVTDIPRGRVRSAVTRDPTGPFRPTEINPVSPKH